MASIRERHSERTKTTTWAVLFRHNGKQKSQTFATPEAAERFRSLVELLGPEKALVELNGTTAAKKLSVDDLFAEWIAWKANSGDVTERTVKDYARDYDNWIRRPLGQRTAESIDERDVQNLVDSMRRAGLDAKSVGDRHMILHSMYKFGSAKVRQLVSHNPCLETQLPRRHKKPAKGLTAPELKAVYAAAQQVDPDAADLLLFIAGTGWRWSEAAVLKVSGVEVYNERGRSVMYATMQRVNRQGAEADDAAKSYAGFRRAKLTPRTRAMVERRLVGKGPDDLVFTKASGRRWHQQNFLNRTWTDILEVAGIAPYPDGRRKTPHAVRHSHIGMLERAGASLPQMQRRAGHEDIQTTINVYGGMIDDVSDEILDDIDEQLFGEDGYEVVSGSVVSEGSLEVVPLGGMQVLEPDIHHRK